MSKKFKDVEFDLYCLHENVHAFVVEGNRAAGKRAVNGLTDVITALVGLSRSLQKPVPKRPKSTALSPQNRILREDTHTLHDRTPGFAHLLQLAFELGAYLHKVNRTGRGNKKAAGLVDGLGDAVRGLRSEIRVALAEPKG